MVQALLLAGVLGVLAIGTPSTAQAAWDNSSGSWVYYDNTGSLHKGWLRTTTGDYYFMDLTTGKMCTGWKQINNSWYYFQDNGVMVASNWIIDNGEFYYLFEDGKMITGWLKIGDIYRYMKDSGAMRKGWQRPGRHWLEADQ